MAKYMVVNKETGEVVIEDFMMIGRKPKYVDRGFIKIFVAFLSDIVENQKIAGKAIRLLFYMLERLDYNTYTIHIIPKYAKEDLKVSYDTLYRWFEILIEEGIITKIDTYTYRLNPYVAVKGNSKKAMENSIEKNAKEIRL